MLRLRRSIFAFVLLFFAYLATANSTRLSTTDQTFIPVGTYRPGTRPAKSRQRAWTVGTRDALNSVRGGTTCSWDAASSTCTASNAAVATLLGESEDAYIRLVSKYAVCNAALDAKACADVGYCLWNSNTTACEFVQFDEGHQDSPCVEASPATIAITIDGAICAEIKNKDSCNSDTRCTWDYTESACVMDFYGRLFGFTYDELLQAIESKTSQLIEPFFEEFRPLDLGFRWTDVLKWQLPKTECPEKVPAAACIVADALLEIEIPVEFYCQVQYSMVFLFPKCLVNPRCRYDFDAMRCSAADDTMRFAWGKGFEAMAALTEKRGDKSFFKEQASCAVILEKNSCTGKCVWEHGETCNLRDTIVFKSMSALGDSDSDPVCILLNKLAELECLDIDDYSKCIANPLCAWASNQECMVSADYLIAEAIDREATLKEAYTSVQDKCASYENNRACENDQVRIAAGPY